MLLDPRKPVVHPADFGALDLKPVKRGASSDARVMRKSWSCFDRPAGIAAKHSSGLVAVGMASRPCNKAPASSLEGRVRPQRPLRRVAREAEAHDGARKETAPALHKARGPPGLVVEALGGMRLLDTA